MCRRKNRCNETSTVKYIWLIISQFLFTQVWVSSYLHLTSGRRYDHMVLTHTFIITTYYCTKWLFIIQFLKLTLIIAKLSRLLAAISSLLLAGVVFSVALIVLTSSADHNITAQIIKQRKFKITHLTLNTHKSKNHLSHSLIVCTRAENRYGLKQETNKTTRRFRVSILHQQRRLLLLMRSIQPMTDLENPIHFETCYQKYNSTANGLRAICKDSILLPFHFRPDKISNNIATPQWNRKEKMDPNPPLLYFKVTRIGGLQLSIR